MRKLGKTVNYLIVSSLLNKTKKITQQKKAYFSCRLHLKMLLIVALLHSASVQALTITTSIPPLAGMIAPLLSADDEVKVILKAGQSPHNFQMSPANMQQLVTSDLVIWVGSPVDAWLKKPLEVTKASSLSMHVLTNLLELPIRHGGIWEKHLHSKHKPATEGEVEHIEHNQEHDEHQQSKKDNEHSHEYEHDNDTVVSKQVKQSKPRMDGHLWMSYHNTVLLIKAVSAKLQQLKPSQANEIQQKTVLWLSKLADTDKKLETQLSVIKHQPYLVLHDAFQYFEARYALNGVGSIQLNPSVTPSLKRVAELRQRIQNGTVKCVFKEPQFPAKRVLSVVRGLEVEVGSLDPIGVLSNNNHDGSHSKASFITYDRFMQQLAEQFISCLKQP